MLLVEAPDSVWSQLSLQDFYWTDPTRFRSGTFCVRWEGMLIPDTTVDGAQFGIGLGKFPHAVFRLQRFHGSERYLGGLYDERQVPL